MNRKYYLNRLNGIDFLNVLNWLDENNYSYVYEIDENGDGDISIGRKNGKYNYYSDGYDLEIENWVVIYTYRRDWD